MGDNALPRRTFLTRSSGLLIGFATLPVLAGGRDGAIDGTIDGTIKDQVKTDGATTVADMYREMATLGAQLKKEQPGIATKLENSARNKLGIPLDQAIDRSTAARAQQTLTEPERTARELQQDEYVIVMGWLLSHSEASAVLLHAAVDGR